MRTVNMNPIPHDQLEEIFSYVFKNEFEQRKINFAMDLMFNKKSYNFYLYTTLTTGKYTHVETADSKGRIQTIHFWVLDGDYKNKYQPKYCYSIIKED